MGETKPRNQDFWSYARRHEHKGTNLRATRAIILAKSPSDIGHNKYIHIFPLVRRYHTLSMSTIKSILSRKPVSKTAIKEGLRNEVPIGENWGIAQFDVLYDWFTKKDRDSFTAKALFVMQYYCEMVRHIFSNIC